MRLAPLLRPAPWVLSVAAWAAAGPAAAGAWGYVDGRGRVHLAAEQVDGRYERIATREAPAGEARVPGKSDGARRLATWLEFAPEVKALQPVLREAAQRYRVDVDLLKAVIAVESGFKAGARSRSALGLMQIMPATADAVATPAERRRPATERLLDERVNVHTGARLLRRLLDRYDGRHDVALAAWNAGEGTVRRHGNQVPPFAETRAHVHQVLELYWALRQRGVPRPGGHPASPER